MKSLMIRCAIAFYFMHFVPSAMVTLATLCLCVCFEAVVFAGCVIVAGAVIAGFAVSLFGGTGVVGVGELLSAILDVSNKAEFLSCSAVNAFVR